MIKNRAARVATMVFLATLVMVVVGVVVRDRPGGLSGRR